ncbi:MAG: hypothetical protein LiPW15_476 [Parcubacteria group bacterium LiPW_15]|nr:MAG: hypothetical protein LiPW15_476 [Parcubacteria group bacterium LiPW_15]
MDVKLGNLRVLSKGLKNEKLALLSETKNKAVMVYGSRNSENL